MDERDSKDDPGQSEPRKAPARADARAPKRPMAAPADLARTVEWTAELRELAVICAGNDWDEV